MTEQDKIKFNEIYQSNSMELFALLRKYGDDDQYKEGTELMEWKRQMYVALIDLLEGQVRTLDYHAGKKIEPKVQFSEAVLVGKMGA